MTFTSVDWRKYGMPGHESSKRLVSFLYCLARDHLPVGAIEDIWLNQIRDEAVDDDSSTIEFTNGWLAEWAENLAARLEGDYGSSRHEEIQER